MPTERVARDPAITTILSHDGRAIAQRLRVQQLNIITPDGRELMHSVRQPAVRFGTHPGNDVVLEDDAVSRIHFEISADPNGFRLRDLGSTNGTYVDGLRMIDGYLNSGSRITAGLTRIHFA